MPSLLQAIHISALAITLLVSPFIYSSVAQENRYTVETPSEDFALDDFYAKCVTIDGYLIIGSENVHDYALKEAAYLVDQMLLGRDDIRAAMIANGSRLIVMAHTEFTTDVPEHSQLRPKDYWDWRARGLGGSNRDPVCSCGEENLLGFPGDPYSTENILIHEFAHNIHLVGMKTVDPSFDRRVEATYQESMEAGLWEGKYASSNHHEYFAEGVQSWFNTNREDDHDHNHVNTREELIEYDPGLADLCREVFRDNDFSYTRAATRLTHHLEGLDHSQLPRFEWPQRLLDARRDANRGD